MNDRTKIDTNISASALPQLKNESKILYSMTRAINDRMGATASQQ